jgi:hypothetical protein
MEWLVIDDGDERFQIPVENIAFVKVIKRTGFTTVSLKTGHVIDGYVISQETLDKETRS